MCRSRAGFYDGFVPQRTALKEEKGKSKGRSDPWATPAMRQYRRFKEQHPGCVLLFRMGDFYELFDEDARLVAAAIGLTLTQRTTGIDMAGVPHHAIEGYLKKMIDAGFKVAVCDQLEDAALARGIVERGVTRVLTPGTLVDESLLDDGQPNRLIAVTTCDETALLAMVELSTGEVELTAVPLTQLAEEFARLEPAEIVVGDEDEDLATLAAAACRSVSRQPSWSFSTEEGLRVVTRTWSVSSVAGFGLADDDPLLAAAGGLLTYLAHTQGGSESLAHLAPPRRASSSSHVALDATTLRALEVEQTIRGDRNDGTLRSVLSRCSTAMGRRLLRNWLREPLAQRGPIEARHDAVDALLADATQRAHLLDGRVATCRLTPRDTRALGTSIAMIPTIREALPAEGLSAAAAALADHQAMLGPLAERILDQCVESPPAHLREGGLFRDGFDDRLDEARSLQRDAGSWLADYQATLAKDSGIASLKVGFNKVFGYYIEVTHAQAQKVPDSFVRKQTLKNAERYITPDLKDHEERVLGAQAAAIAREQELFADLCATIADRIEELGAVAAVIAEIDVLACFAEVAARYDYCRPAMVDEPVLVIEEGRHPVLDRLLAERFVPNGCMLDAHTLALITGPNMAGKSTYIRQLALLVLMAHAGCFVPAASATIGVVDRIFTRVGASDELHAGHSTFMVEMVETASILNNATPSSLVILDEIGRGTSTLDGLSLAWAVAEALARRGCRTFFATHYHELTDLADRHDTVMNLQVLVREHEGEIVFLHRIQGGSSDRSYGIHVARIAGVPADVVSRANELLATLSVQTDAPGHAPVLPQGDLFATPHPIVQRLAGLDLEGMTPLEAFDVLRDLVDSAR